MFPQKFTLSNGIRVVITPMDGTEAISVMVIVKAGSRCETKRINGLAHFSEHMLFRGGKRYKDKNSIAEAADNIGADYNAETSEETIAFYMQSASSQLEIIVDILSDMIINSRFLTRDIDRERGVVIQEIKGDLDDPATQILTDWQELIFPNHALGRPILGTVPSIKGFTRDDFLKYYLRFYANKNIVISVAGKISDVNNIFDILEKYFGSKPQTKASNWLKFQKSNAHSGNKVFLRKQDTQQAHLIVGVPAFARKHQLSPATYLLSLILGGGMSSRLFSSIREKQGLCYHISTDYIGMQDTGYFYTYAGVDITKIEQAIISVLVEYENVRREGITQQELDKAKSMLEGGLALGLEGSMSVARFFAEQELIYGNIRSIIEILDSYRSLTLDDMFDAISKILNKEKMLLSIIGLFDNKEKFVKLIS